MVLELTSEYLKSVLVGLSLTRLANAVRMVKSCRFAIQLLANRIGKYLASDINLSYSLWNETDERFKIHLFIQKRIIHAFH